MTTPIDFKITEENGRRYAVVPFEQFQALIDAVDPNDLYFPHEIVECFLDDKVSLVRAWREYFGLTQKALAQRLNVSQPQIAQWERPDANLRHITLKKVASAMGLHVAQLTLDDDIAATK